MLRTVKAKQYWMLQLIPAFVRSLRSMLTKTASSLTKSKNNRTILSWLNKTNRKKLMHWRRKSMRLRKKSLKTIRHLLPNKDFKSLRKKRLLGLLMSFLMLIKKEIVKHLLMKKIPLQKSRNLRTKQSLKASLAINLCNTHIRRRS